MFLYMWYSVSLFHRKRYQMGSHPHSSSFNPGRGQANQQVRNGDLYSAIGNISGGIIRFNIGTYKQTPDVDHIKVHNKKATHRALRMHDGQVAPDVKGDSSPAESAKD